MSVLGQKASETIHYKLPVVGDTITSAVWSISPSGPTVTTVATTSTYSVCAISGTTSGVVYALKCMLSVASGQIFEVLAQING